ncbi:cutinase family protein [Nocardia stercoris]|uniref:Cutinase family protein n=2 Tax=Nocardia stercoris TaxID=2483361 RepID=A0A3M2LAI4_9NOCA|nr:cutinase family protein [Nocardia stercoris]
MSGLTLAESGTAAADSGCPSVDVVAVPGTWETGDQKNQAVIGGGMLAGVTDGLPGSMQVDYISYPATAFPWEGAVYGSSKDVAVKNAEGVIKDMAARCAATKFAILGYSQGADAAGDVAARIGTGRGVIPANRVTAVGLLSDPSRSPADTQVGPQVPGSGAAGTRPGGFGVLTDRVRTICVDGDLYCSTPEGDYLTRAIGFAAELSAVNPGDLGRLVADGNSLVGDILANGGIPMLQNAIGNDQGNRERVEKLAEFYGAGAHTSYGTYDVGGGESALQWMHQWIAGQN